MKTQSGLQRGSQRRRLGKTRPVILAAGGRSAGTGTWEAQAVSVTDVSLGGSQHQWVSAALG